MNHFYAHGKLLLSGEYLVLKGALALALPLNKGQKLTVEESHTSGLEWTAQNPDGLWFSARFNDKLQLSDTTNQSLAANLQKILEEAVAINPEAKEKLLNKKVSTTLEFNPFWGWGSSSTLLYILGIWLQLDPYRLLDATFGGSGYDIACAGSNTPIFYQRNNGETPFIEQVTFNPPFIDQMGIVYLNKKQSSSVQVRKFLDTDFINQHIITEISAISKSMSLTKDFNDFARLMQQHEKLTAVVTGLIPVKQELFPEFPGTLKSLGAWGGDFILYLSDLPFEEIRTWFQLLGYDTVMKMSDVVKK
jgi:mevalonate kinase